MLDAKNAKELEQRVLDRLSKDGNKDALTLQFRQIATRSAVIALQEYERMLSEEGQE